MKLVALAGGVGGAKMADGFYRLAPRPDLTVVVNTGDDFEHLGLTICPDLDTVCYTLAGIANPATGWGRADESWNALETIKKLAGATWFNIGDRDLGQHLERTRRLRTGEPLHQITRHFCRAWDIHAVVLPMTDDVVSTWVYTIEADELPFQEYFVHQQCQPQVTGFRFAGCEQARPAPGVLEAFQQSDLVVICPSNPWVSIGPILAVPGILDALQEQKVIAVSPIIGGKAVKGPAAKMFSELGIEPSALAVARHYRQMLGSKFAFDFVIDQVDCDQATAIEAMGITPLITDILMATIDDRLRLARQILEFAGFSLTAQAVAGDFET